MLWEKVVGEHQNECPTGGTQQFSNINDNIRHLRSPITSTPKPTCSLTSPRTILSSYYFSPPHLSCPKPGRKHLPSFYSTSVHALVPGISYPSPHIPSSISSVLHSSFCSSTWKLEHGCKDLKSLVWRTVEFLTCLCFLLSLQLCEGEGEAAEVS